MAGFKIETTILLFLFFNFESIGQNFYEEGIKEYTNGSEAKAVDLFSKSINGNIEVAKSYMYRGAAKCFLDDFYGSIKDLKYSLELDSNEYLTYFYLGRSYSYQGFNKIAIQYYDIALNLNKTDGDIYDERAVAKGMEGDLTGAIKDEDSAIKIDPTVSDYYANRGFAKSALKMYNEAIEDFNTAINKGNNSQAYVNRGIARAKLNFHQLAVADFTKAIELLPNAIDVPYLRGISYKALGDKIKGCEDIRKSAEMGYSPAILEIKNCK